MTWRRNLWGGNVHCTSCKMSFHGILAALSKTFFWKKTCTRCSDSSAITGTKKDQRGSWSSSWGVVCSRTLIADVHGLGSGKLWSLESITWRKIFGLAGCWKRMRKSSLSSRSDPKYECKEEQCTMYNAEMVDCDYNAEVEYSACLISMFCYRPSCPGWRTQAWAEA